MQTLQVNDLEAVTRSRLATVPLHTPLREVAQRLSGTQIALVAVCDADGVLAGVISKTDIVRQIGHCMGSACCTLASHVMKTDVVTCEPTDLLEGVLDLMRTRGLVHLPVLDACKHPVGIVNARDILRALLAQGEYEQSLLFDYVMGVGYH